MSLKSMCPYCGDLFDGMVKLIPKHAADWSEDDDQLFCVGSEQVPRNPEAGARLLWSGKPNPHLLRAERGVLPGQFDAFLGSGT